jgi:Tfp pilus assembly protein PilF
MAVILEKKDRRLIPNWRSFAITTMLGEIDATSINPIIVQPDLSIADYIEDFHENATIPFAGDLISASMVNGFNENEEVKKAANFILDSKGIVTKTQLSIAERIILGAKDNSENQIENKTIRELNDSLPENDYRLKIQQLKKYVIEFPYNPIAWVELSRYYSILGQEKQSERAMKIALQLAPDNRFVLRCAVRLFSHYDEIDIAHDILKKNKITSYDPWLTSAEIAIATLQGRSSRFIKRGIELVESKNLSPFSITELASSIATIELFSGNRKKSKKMFTKSLIAPNDNSLAQMEWVLNKDKTLFDRDQINISTQWNFEAQALYNFYNKQLIEALNNTYQWFCDMPFSKRPVMLGSLISNVLGSNDLSIKFLEHGLISHPNDAQMLNNIAYYLALENKTTEANKYLDKVDFKIGINKLTVMCLKATYGLICFSENRYDEGRNYYLHAIKDAESEKDTYHACIAILNYAREEIKAQTDYIESAMQLVSKIPQNEDENITIQNLHSEVIDLYDKYRLNAF